MLTHQCSLTNALQCSLTNAHECSLTMRPTSTRGSVYFEGEMQLRFFALFEYLEQAVEVWWEDEHLRSSFDERTNTCVRLLMRGRTLAFVFWWEDEHLHSSFDERTNTCVRLLMRGRTLAFVFWWEDEHLHSSFDERTDTCVRLWRLLKFCSGQPAHELATLIPLLLCVWLTNPVGFIFPRC